MKSIRSISDVERANRNELYKNHQKHHIRRRAHAIPCSLKGFAVNDISRLFNVNRNTVCAWLQLWELRGVPSRFQRHRPGCPCILAPIDVKRLSERVKEEPRQIKVASARLASEIGKTFSLRTVTPTLNKLNFMHK